MTQCCIVMISFSLYVCKNFFIIIFEHLTWFCQDLITKWNFKIKQDLPIGWRLIRIPWVIREQGIKYPTPKLGHMCYEESVPILNPFNVWTVKNYFKAGQSGVTKTFSHDSLFTHNLWNSNQPSTYRYVSINHGQSPKNVKRSLAHEHFLKILLRSAKSK